MEELCKGSVSKERGIQKLSGWVLRMTKSKQEEQMMRIIVLILRDTGNSQVNQKTIKFMYDG